MQNFEWSSIFVSGIDVIDFQHKILVERINEMINSINKNENQENLMFLFVFLEDYIIYHFSTEEQFFNSFNYLDKEKHLREHHEFNEKIVRFKKEYQEGLVCIDESLIEFLLNWLKEHLLDTDKKFTESLKKHLTL